MTIYEASPHMLPRPGWSENIPQQFGFIHVTLGCPVSRAESLGGDQGPLSSLVLSATSLVNLMGSLAPPILVMEEASAGKFSSVVTAEPVGESLRFPAGSCQPDFTFQL